MDSTTLALYTPAAIFALAILHTFLAQPLRRLGDRFESGSLAENVFHLLGELEAVFALWSVVLFAFLVFRGGYGSAAHYVESLSFREPAFVFVIMAVSVTRPLIDFASAVISACARLLPLPKTTAFVFSALVLGALSGSLITEPAAMVLTALLLKERLFDAPGASRGLKYAVLGTLFVNVSVGGVLTPYAAPPVLMVASKWNWDLLYMLQHFGWKAVVAVLVNAGLVVAFHWKALGRLVVPAKAKTGRASSPFWLTALHVFLLGAVVFNAHSIALFCGVFLLFLAIAEVTREYQTPLKIKESLMVATFLAGLVVLGELQNVWLEPLLSQMSEQILFIGAAALTAVTDNAALTYLGSRVNGLTESMQYALVAGAVAGGGLTVIANAPNPVGFSILQKSFGREGITPWGILKGAALPTIVVMIAFWFLPHLSN